jgi:hypothetical protein
LPLDISRENRIFLALWRKAIRKEEVRLKCLSDNQAITTRLAMYRAIKPFRMDEFEDPELYDAANRLAIRIEGSDIIIVEKTSTITAEAAMLQFGLTEDDLLTPEERVAQSRMEEQLEKLIERDSSDIPLKQKNEFY